MIRAPVVMSGYWNRPEATAEALDEDGWLHTGDLARQDEDGYFFIVDRKKELIIRGGFNIYPREIEEVLYEHPGDPRGRCGRHPAREAWRGGGRSRGAKGRGERHHRGRPELREGARRRLQVPAPDLVVEQLPKGATGKILKREIHPPAASRPNHSRVTDASHRGPHVPPASGS